MLSGYGGDQKELKEITFAGAVAVDASTGATARDGCIVLAKGPRTWNLRVCQILSLTGVTMRFGDEQ